MWTVIKRIFASPVFNGDEDKTRSAQLLNGLLWLVLVGVIFFAGSVFFTLQNEMEPLVMTIAAILGIVTVVMFVLLRLGYVMSVGIILAFTLWVGFTIPMFNFAGIHDSAITGYFFVIALVGVVAGWRSLVFFSGLTTAALVAAYYAEQTGYLIAVVPLPSKIDDLILVLLMLGSTALMLWYAVQRLNLAYERVRQNAEALQLGNQELDTIRLTVEAQAAELQQRAHYLATTARVARDAAELLNTPRAMMLRVVDIIANAFDYYLVSIFLTDEAGEWAELRAASNEDGLKLIERNYRLRIGAGWAGEGIVGNVAENGKRRIVRDVQQEVTYVDTSELRETVSEIAFPLMVRGLVIGVLDIQSSRAESFPDSEIELLQGIVNQVALVVDNARLVNRLQLSATVQQDSFRGLAQEVWLHKSGFQANTIISDRDGTAARAVEWSPEMIKAIQTGEAVPDEQHSTISLPIKAHGETIGVIDALLPTTEGSWTDEQIALLYSITQQLGTALEVAHLYNETQLQVVRETLTREVTDKMRNTVSWDDLLRTALREISEVMGVSRAFVQWLPADPQPATMHNEEQDAM